jgi:preprotein translocase subunit SecD
LFVLVVLVALYVGLFFGKGGHGRTPSLGIDLRGGTTVTLVAQPIGSSGGITKSELNEAVSIIRNRVDGAGVGGADINTQGSNEIVVTVPGQGRNILDVVERTALLSFRQVLLQPGASAVTTTPTVAPSAGSSGAPTSAPSGKSTGKSTGKAGSGKTSGKGGGSGSGTLGGSTSGTAQPDVIPLTKATKPSKPKPSAKASATPAVTSSPAASGSSTKGTSTKGKATKGKATKGKASATPTAGSSNPAVTVSPSVSPSTPVKKAPPARTYPGNIVKRGGFIVASPKLSDVRANYAKLNCLSMSNNPTSGIDIPGDFMLSCDSAGASYLLAPSTVTPAWKTGGVQGSQVSSASSGFDSNQGGYAVTLNFKSAGSSDWQKVTKAAAQETNPPASQGCNSSGLGCNAVAIVLDGQVQSAPYIEDPAGIAGQAEISGNFSQSSAASLADVLNYGSLPLRLNPGQAQSISATLGSSQLRGGLIAGVISLALVALFSLVYYRALGLVTIASLLLSGLILYSITTMLGHSRLGYTLSLAGIAGFIVAVGITADSFVVFFERLRDEVREGRRLRSGVDRAWPRARRTIISADAVSLLAAVILYLVSISDVRGFAFTLGLSTLSDLFIVFFFTKPLLTLLARRPAFDRGRTWTGVGRDRAGRRQTVTPTPAMAEED